MFVRMTAGIIFVCGLLQLVAGIFWLTLGAYGGASMLMLGGVAAIVPIISGLVTLGLGQLLTLAADIADNTWIMRQAGSTERLVA